MANLELAQVRKSFGGLEIVHGVDLAVGDREFVVLVGPSGCGRSTILRMIAGLEDVSGGTIAIDGRVVNEVDSQDRDIAMVFQDYALYPHMNVFENMAFSLRYRGVARAETARRVDAAPSREVWLGVRPEHLVWHADDGAAAIVGEAGVVEPLGSDTMVSVDVAGAAVLARLPPRLARRAGERVALAIEPAQIHVFDRATERHL